MSNTPSLTLSALLARRDWENPGSPSGTAWQHMLPCTAGVTNTPPEKTGEPSADASLTGSGVLASFLRQSRFLRYGSVKIAPMPC